MQPLYQTKGLLDGEVFRSAYAWRAIVDVIATKLRYGHALVARDTLPISQHIHLQALHP